jgi:cytoskeletal protein RodZ
VSIGEALAQARLQAGLGVAQVSDQTRIRETIITALEHNDYSVCGGDSYARGYIRTIARAVGADPDPLIQEYNTARPRPQPASKDRAEPASKDRAEPARFTGMGERLWRAWLVVVVLVMAGLWFVALRYHAGPRHAVTAAPSAQALPAAHRQRGQPSPARPPAQATTIPPRTLIPASAAAFGPSGTGQGDNSDLAYLAIDAEPDTAWHTDWYATAHFGNLYTGTGLLVDMGRSATITAARISLGRAHGAGLQLRVGNAPALADLPPVAQRANAGGVVRLRLMRPAHGRYVLLWFTSLPPDSAGTFQVRVYNLRLEGRT